MVFGSCVNDTEHFYFENYVTEKKGKRKISSWFTHPLGIL